MIKKICIVPIRSSSKGLKHKNIIKLKGKHLFYWTVKCAIDSNLFNEVVVLTDSDEYIALCRYYGFSF